MTGQQFSDQLNKWGATSTPFFFIIDFEQQKPVAFPLDALPAGIQCCFPEFSNGGVQRNTEPILLEGTPLTVQQYSKKYKIVEEALAYGNTFLANLTIKTLITTKKTLKEIFDAASAPYKLLYKDEFVVYSPETFVKIKDGKIYSYPMKGTIDASVPNAEHVIINDLKETSEHVTIVDLIRNDLSMVAVNVRVTKFRYVDRIKTSTKTLLQVSSEIVGDLPGNYLANVGSILASLLPAGSVSGAPKKRTCEMLRQAEEEPRGYYTGVMGYFDGKNLDTAVMIRYIEKVGGQYYYRSGGGITTQSECQKEYEEALAKIYVPVV